MNQRKNNKPPHRLNQRSGNLIQPKLPAQKQITAPPRYDPNPTSRCLQLKATSQPKAPGPAIPSPVATPKQRVVAPTKTGGALQHSFPRPIPAKPPIPHPHAAQARNPGTIQRMSFARFWTHGVFSYWGSYSDKEKRLLDQEKQAHQFLSTLDMRTRQRAKVQKMESSLKTISASTIAEKDYRSIMDQLIQINNDLTDERDRQLFEDRLEQNRRGFEKKGTPEKPDIPTFYPEKIDTEIWSKLTERGSEFTQGSVQQLVEHLFHNFISQGFNYSLMTSAARSLIGTGVTTQTAEGNCIAYAQAFADLLNSYGIDAEVRAVRRDDEGHFIVRVPTFMDPKVPGHIFVDGVLQRGYYLFSFHEATWVPSLNKFYDPMAKSSYINLTQSIECELQSDEKGQNFYLKGRSKTLQPGCTWKLVRKSENVTGGFFRLDLQLLD